MIIFHGNDWFHLSLAVSVLLKFQRNFYLKNVRHLVLLWIFYTIQHFPLAQTLQITSVLLCVRVFCLKTKKKSYMHLFSVRWFIPVESFINEHLS